MSGFEAQKRWIIQEINLEAIKRSANSLGITAQVIARAGSNFNTEPALGSLYSWVIPEKSVGIVLKGNKEAIDELTFRTI